MKFGLRPGEGKPLDLMPGLESNLGCRPHRFIKGRQQMTVLDHIGRRPARLMLDPEIQQCRTRPIGLAIRHHDFTHGLGMRCNRIPYPHRLKHAPCRLRDGRGPTVKSGLGCKGRIALIHQRHLERRSVARPAESQGCGKAVQPRAANGNVENLILMHGPNLQPHWPASNDSFLGKSALLPDSWACTVFAHP